MIHIVKGFSVVNKAPQLVRTPLHPFPACPPVCSHPPDSGLMSVSQGRPGVAGEAVLWDVCGAEELGEGAGWLRLDEVQRGKG